MSTPPTVLFWVAISRADAKAELSDAFYNSCCFVFYSVGLPLGTVTPMSTGKFFLKYLLGFIGGCALEVFPRWGAFIGGSSLCSFGASTVVLLSKASTLERNPRGTEGFLNYLNRSSSFKLKARATCFSVLSLFECVSLRTFCFVILLILSYSRWSSYEIFILMYSLLKSFWMIEFMLSVGSETIP